MKKSFFLHLPIVVLILVIFGCTNKAVESPSNQKSVWVDAGVDQLIFLPQLETHLTAGALDILKYQTNLKYEWKKTKGPDKFKMDDPTKFNPFLSDLETGIYEFAFTATTTDRRFDTDTVIIRVAEPIGEFVIQNLIWVCPMGCELQLQVKIPKDKPVRIYIKPQGSTSNWVEASNIYSPSITYPVPHYAIDKESLWIYADDQSSNYDVKIVFQ